MILLLFSWIGFTGLVRAEVLRARNFTYVRAARALGLPSWRLLLRHVFAECDGSYPDAFAFHLGGFGDDFDFFRLSGALVCRQVRLRWVSCFCRAQQFRVTRGLCLQGFFSLATLLTLLIFVGEAVRDVF